MPLYEVEIPTDGIFAAEIRAKSREDAIRFMERMVEKVVSSAGLMDESYEVARELGIDAEMEGFDISGPVPHAVILSENEEV